MQLIATDQTVINNKAKIIDWHSGTVAVWKFIL